MHEREPSVDLLRAPGPAPTAGIGVIVPFDFALDRELWRWVPEDAALHVTRTPFVPSPVTAEMARVISDPEPVQRATRDVLVPEPGVVAYACTSGSFVDGAAGEIALTGVIADAGAPLALTTSGALVEALKVLGASRVAVVTPYVDDLTDKLAAFLAAHGVETVGSVGLGLLGQIWRVTYDEVVRAVRAADRPEAEAVFISCTNLATYDVIAPLERLLGKPVITANQVTVWAALRAVGRRAVGPGQSLVTGRQGAPAHLRVVPDQPRRKGGGPDGPPVLHKVRVRLPDEAGALARLTEAVARAEGNILGLAVHGQDSRSVVDEMFVGSTGSAEDLAEAIRRGVGTAEPVLVTPADPHDLVDAPTRALDLAVQAMSGGDLARGIEALVHADEVRYQPTAPSSDPHVLAVAAPTGGWLVAQREWAPFTVTEQARAEAFVRAAGVEPVRPRWDILTLSGDELVAEPATGEELGAVEELLCECLATLGPDGERTTWTDRELRDLLITPRGPALLVRDGERVVALGAVVDGEVADEHGAPVLLVHPHYRGMRLGRWLRKRLAERSGRPAPTLPV
ncbi:Maleate cis-trans isomerase [Pseudonocardia oroxyli]|uniref:Maleate cis-trans isomerase n=1 Tax=Pseudonocardia oroxyli TaxID=366584 RepID=A0A1G7YPZ3_PSEOR|nr:Maleate cis-trans isomerase [Pseudonocardia oroxyli]